jgi:hypothetical protein
VSKDKLEPGGYIFCKKCREEHSYHVLVVQAEHQNGIRDVLLDSKVFNTAAGMADYVGVSVVSIYHWMWRYFGMTFQEFRREHICKSDKCYLLDISKSPYSRGDYVLKKVKDRRYCACINELGRKYMMTCAPFEVVSSILGTKLKIVDFLYRRPNRVYPIYLSKVIEPIYLQKFPYPIYT